jgi:NTE family protein
MKKALVLGSGGIRGMAHVAFLEILREKQKDNFDIITGCSIGALIGGVYALDPSVNLYKIAEEVIEENINQLKKVSKTMNSKAVNYRFQSFTGLLSNSGVNPNEIIYDIAKELFGSKKFSDCEIPFGVISYDLDSSKSVEINEGFLTDAVLASANVPGAFDPIRLGGMHLVDGGVLSSLPIDLAIKMGAEYLITNDISPSVKKEDFENGMEYMNNIDLFKIYKINEIESKKANENYKFETQVTWDNFQAYKEIYKKAKEYYGSVIE